MKIFISSLIGGFEPFRAAARSAVTTLKHEAVMAEDFPAQPNSPQIACLQGVRSADLVVLILGERYGSVQGTSGVSPTHEEFLEARNSRPVFVFVQEGVTREPQQAKFVTEVQGWQHGYFRGGFTTPEQLRDLVTGAIHEYQLAHATAPLDTGAVMQAAIALLPREGRGNTIQSPALHLSVACGPQQNILRPAELEAKTLESDMHQRALFAEPLLFDRSKGVENDIDGAALFLEQDGGSRIQLDEQGRILLRLPLQERKPRGHGFGGSFAIIEETVLRQLSAGIAYTAWLLERIERINFSARSTAARLRPSAADGATRCWRSQAPTHC